MSTPDTVSRKLLTPAEVRAELKIGRATFYRMLKDGYLPSVRISARLLRIPASAIDALAASAVAK